MTTEGVHHASSFLAAAMTAIPAAVALVVAWGYARAGRARGEPGRARAGRFLGAVAVLGIWMLAAALLARAGVLLDFARRPPPMLLVMLASVGAGAAVGLSPVGARLARGLPLAALIGAQAFRLPLELVMHRAAGEGVMPVQMSFGGWNFDVITGASALAVAALLATRRAPRALAVAWNVVGAALLANIAAIAVASMPALHAFGAAPDRLNTWVGELPFVWLPTVLVPAALAGHIVVARNLLASRSPSGDQSNRRNSALSTTRRRRAASAIPSIADRSSAF
jgi:hypothetical protein